MKQESTGILEKLKARWSLLLGTALGFILSTVAFTIFPDIAKNTKNNPICSEWTGFCQGETSLESEETTVSQGRETLTKKTRATQFQSGKTLWDWLQLAAIPLLLVILGYQLQSRDRERSQKQAVLDKEIASANLRDEALGNYIERMSELLLDKNLKNSSDDALVRDIAITRTLTILRRLGNDSERKTIVIRFLEEAEIIFIIRKKFSGINLSGANLFGANLSEAVLFGANLSGGDLSGTNLSGTDLFGANLSGANLSGANLSEADLSGANLSGTNLIRANLNGADLFGADLFGANLIRANLGGANLIRANLNRANLNGANLRGSDLFRANFREVNLLGTHLFKTQNLNPKQIKTACYWQQAIYSEAQWELFQWVAKDEKANQKIIEALKQDNASDPKTPINCSHWQ